MLTFKNFIVQQEENINSKKKAKNILEYYLDYIEWLIGKLRDKPDEKSEYTTTELLVQIKLIGEYCKQQAKLTEGSALVNVTPLWHEAHVADVRASMPAVLRACDRKVYNTVRDHVDAGNHAQAQKYLYANRFSTVLLLGSVVLSFIPKAVLALPLPGYGIKLLFAAATMIFAGAAYFTGKKANQFASKIVSSADEFKEGHTSYNRLVMKQPYVTGFTHRPVVERAPVLEDTSVLLFNNKSRGVHAACQSLEGLFIKEHDPAEACTLSSMLTTRYKNLYSNYDEYKALDIAQFAQTNLGDDKPADLEDVAEKLREKMSGSISL